MVDFLDFIIQNVKRTIKEGYYNVQFDERRLQRSLKDSIVKCKKIPIIAEIKPASPKDGVLKKEMDAKEMAIAIKRGGAVGISVLTEPKHFKGSLEILSIVRKTVDLPILMKDFIISPVQIEAADKIGADAILLIKSIFDREFGERNLNEMIEIAKSKGIEVLLEVHNEDEFLSSLQTEADMIGINNRDLTTLNVDLEVTKRILSKIENRGRIIVSESGINHPTDVKALHNFNIKAFLIGKAIMTARDVEAKIREFVEAT
ncbi:MAG: indole-3-glycerol-phosphate synthase [Nitrososphaerales archaeon]